MVRSWIGWGPSINGWKQSSRLCSPLALAFALLRMPCSGAVQSTQRNLQLGRASGSRCWQGTKSLTIMLDTAKGLLVKQIECLNRWIEKYTRMKKKCPLVFARSLDMLHCGLPIFAEFLFNDVSKTRQHDPAWTHDHQRCHLSHEFQVRPR